MAVWQQPINKRATVCSVTTRCMAHETRTCYSTAKVCVLVRVRVLCCHCDEIERASDDPGLGPKVGPRVSVGSKLVLHSCQLLCLQLLSSSGQIATVMAHSTVKVPCTNIKAVALGGY
eukprot:6125129-Prymnesium_polylepis.1